MRRSLERFGGVQLSRTVIGRSSVGCRYLPFSGLKNSVRMVRAGRSHHSRPNTSVVPVVLRPPAGRDQISATAGVKIRLHLEAVAAIRWYGSVSLDGRGPDVGRAKMPVLAIRPVGKGGCLRGCLAHPDVWPLSGTSGTVGWLGEMRRAKTGADDDGAIPHLGYAKVRGA